MKRLADKSESKKRHAKSKDLPLGITMMLFIPWIITGLFYFSVYFGIHRNPVVDVTAEIIGYAVIILFFITLAIAVVKEIIKKRRKRQKYKNKHSKGHK